MTFSPDYSETFDIDGDNQDDVVVNYADWDGDHVPHAVSATIDTNDDEVPDVVMELNPVDGTVISTAIDVNYDEHKDVVYDNITGTISMADLDGDGISTGEEVATASETFEAALGDA